MTNHEIPNAIKITSRLNPSNAKALHRWSARMYERTTDSLAALNVGRSLWAPMVEEVPDDYATTDTLTGARNRLHSMAQRMMTAAGTTFRYELVTR